jgi:hypothetical protein
VVHEECEDDGHANVDDESFAIFEHRTAIVRLFETV